MRHGTTPPKGRPLAGMLVLVLAGCTPAADAPETNTPAPGQPDLSAALVRHEGTTPPDGPADACWANDQMPAVIETVTEQVLISPEERDAAGAVTRAAVFSTKVDQRMVRDREFVWFRTPCPAAMDDSFLASLQRALKARGLYRQDLSGEMDTETRAAIRRFQAERGLDSDTLSLAAAQALGLIEIPRDAL